MYTIAVCIYSISAVTDLHVCLLWVVCCSPVTHFCKTSLHDTQYGFQLWFLIVC